MSSTGSITTAFSGWPATESVDTYRTQANNETLAIPRSLLRKLIQDHHTVYHMEHRDIPNILARVLVGLHELGANQDQLINGYKKVHPDLVPLLQTSIEKNTIADDSWLEHLGDSTYYRQYLSFFQQKIEQRGVEKVVQEYFCSSPLLTSIGSQLQPIVHMAFGLEYDMPEIVVQGLAYLATTFVDVEPLLEEASSSSGYSDNSSILFDMVAADPRFAGRMDGTNTFHSAVKVLIKSQQSLLGMYMRMVKSKLQDLVTLAAQLIPCTQQAHRLDWFLGGGQLLASALAIQFLVQQPYVDEDAAKKLVQLQFLATMCTYVVQGRPDRPPSHDTPCQTWENCASAVVQSGDPKSILIMQSLSKAQQLFGEQDEGYLQVANFIAGFVQADGAWCKTDERSVR
ncbi:hypothetical protein BJV82DRAFT_616521 [Fennellomyces sp. T-0311]|nr:hypothetical protein BJV82DRAFT_616521 [Fennellomyces sp. T-0311]